MGPYPLGSESSKHWVKAASFLTVDLLQQLFPSGVVAGEKKCYDFYSETVFRFSAFDLKRSFPTDASPEVRSKYSIDKSHLLKKVLERYQQGRTVARLSFNRLFLLRL